MRRHPAAVLLSLGALLLSRSGAEEPARTGTVEQAEVRAILIDAVITDAEGRPARGLKASDFTLRVDGKASPISGFEDHCAAPPASPAVAASAVENSAPPQDPEAAISPEAAAPSVPLAEPPPGSDQVTATGSGAAGAGGDSGGGKAAEAAGEPMRIVLYFDLPHLSGPSASRSVRHAKRFLEKSAGEGQPLLVMIATFGPEIRVLLPFTADRSAVLPALDRVLERGAQFDEGPQARVGKVQSVTHETCPSGGESPSGVCDNQILLAKAMAHEEEVIAKRSLGALKDFLVSLSGVPGRKALVFFTETLKDEPGVQYLEIARTTPRGQLISIEMDLRAAVEEANASAVSFYPVYSAGLSDPGDTEITRSQTSLGTAGEKTPSAGEVLARSALPKAAGTLETDVGALANAERTGEAAALGFNQSVAAETGGRHLGRTNDLSLIFPIVTAEMSCYYVLSYQPAGAADGKRHGVTVETARKDLKIRARPYFFDFTSADRSDRRFQTALAAPGAFSDMPVAVDAFALGRARKGRQVLVKLSVPVEALARSASGVPPDDGVAEIEVRGRVTNEKNVACSFEGAFRLEGAPVKVAQSKSRNRQAFLHYEAACSIPAGAHEVVAAVMERRGGIIGAARRTIGVPAIGGFHLGDAQLWSASADDHVEQEQAAAIFGATKGVAAGRATPRGERRLLPGEKGSLFFVVCPASGGAPPVVTVTRSLLSDETAVAVFPPLKLTEAPDPASGCWGVSSDIPVGVLGDGVYSFVYEAHAAGAAEPVSRRIAFAVGSAAGVAAPVPDGKK